MSRIKLEVENDSGGSKSQEEPEFTEHPNDAFISSKAAITLQCVVKNANKTLMECNSKVREETRSSISMVDGVKYETLSLFIKRRDIENKTNGNGKRTICKCVAFSHKNERFVSNKAVVKISYLEEDFESEPMDEAAYENETVEMRCDPPKGEPSPTVHWLKDGRAIDTSSDSSRYKLSNDFSLLILVSKAEDAGDYVCVASNEADKRQSKPAKLTLLSLENKYFWSEWSEWSECPVECGQGLVKRYRTCQTTNRMSQVQNVSIPLCGIAQSVEDQICQRQPCSVLAPEWSEWSAWSTCSNECKQIRRRICNNEHLIELNQMDDASSACVGEKLTSRTCLNSKHCKEKHQKVDFNQNTHQINSQNNNLALSKSNQKMIDMDYNFNFPAMRERPIDNPSRVSSFEYKWSIQSASFAIGLVAGILLLIALISTLIVCLKRKGRKNRSELNLYYTCEKQIAPDDECSIFKFSKGSSVASSCSSSSPRVKYREMSAGVGSGSGGMASTNDSHLTPRIFDNLFDLNERQLLLNSIKNKKPPTQHSDMFTLDSALNRQNSNSSTTTTTTSSNNNNNKQNTKLTTISPSQSSDIYSYATPVHNRTNQSNDDVIYQIISVESNAATLISSPNDSMYKEIPTCFDNKLKILNSNSLSTDLKNFFSSDLCVGQVNSSGAKLSLNCGLSLIIPEDALPPEQTCLMYLGIQRQEMFKPKLNDKNTLLSEVVAIGPPTLTLLKPVILTMEHCAKNISQDWNVTLYSAFNTFDTSPEWIEAAGITSDQNTNLNVFVNASDSHFMLITDKLGRYALTGESLKQRNNNAATKHLRLVAFCSTSITDNDLILRIYCVDNLISALQEVLIDEKKIGGTLLDFSEPFQVSYSKIAESLSIFVDQISPDSLNCKYNMNCQEIPLSHIWNERNHLLHCSFTFERSGDELSEESFRCEIRGYQAESNSNQLTLSVALSLQYNLENILRGNKQICEENFAQRLIELGRSNLWPNATRLANLTNHAKDYLRVDKNFKKQACSILDDTYSHENNWRTLAQCLGISRNLHYFASKASPTEMLLHYFEAINDLKSNNYQQTQSRKKSSKTGLPLFTFAPRQQKLQQPLENNLHDLFLNAIKTNQVDLVNYPNLDGSII